MRLWCVGLGMVAVSAFGCGGTPMRSQHASVVEPSVQPEILGESHWQSELEQVASLFPFDREARATYRPGGGYAPRGLLDLVVIGGRIEAALFENRIFLRNQEASADLWREEALPAGFFALFAEEIEGRIVLVGVQGENLAWIRWLPNSTEDFRQASVSTGASLVRSIGEDRVVHSPYASAVWGSNLYVLDQAGALWKIEGNAARAAPFVPIANEFANCEVLVAHAADVLWCASRTGSVFEWTAQAFRRIDVESIAPVDGETAPPLAYVVPFEGSFLSNGHRFDGNRWIARPSIDREYPAAVPFLEHEQYVALPDSRVLRWTSAARSYIGFFVSDASGRDVVGAAGGLPNVQIPARLVSPHVSGATVLDQVLEEERALPEGEQSFDLGQAEYNLPFLHNALIAAGENLSELPPEHLHCILRNIMRAFRYRLPHVTNPGAISGRPEPEVTTEEIEEAFAREVPGVVAYCQETF